MLYGMYNKYELAFITVISAVPVFALIGMGVFAYGQGIDDHLLWTGLIGSMGVGLIVFGDSLVSTCRELFRDNRRRKAHWL